MEGLATGKEPVRDEGGGLRHRIPLVGGGSSGHGHTMGTA